MPPTFHLRDNQQIDPEKQFRKREHPHSNPKPVAPSTQPISRRTISTGDDRDIIDFLEDTESSPQATPPSDGISYRRTPATDVPESSNLSTSSEELPPLSQSAPISEMSHIHHSHHTNLSNHKNQLGTRNTQETIQRELEKKKQKKKRVMSTTGSPNSSPTRYLGGESPLVSPMIVSLTTKVRPPTINSAREIRTAQEVDEADAEAERETEVEPEELFLRRGQQIDPEKQLRKREYPPPYSLPNAPSTQPLPRRSVTGVGSLQSKVLFPNSETTDSGESASSGPDETEDLSEEFIDSRLLLEKERKLLEMEEKINREMEELKLFKQQLLERERAVAEKEKKLQLKY